MNMINRICQMKNIGVLYINVYTYFLYKKNDSY